MADKLFETLPEELKGVAEIAKDYKKVQAQRIAALNEEKNLKQQILDAVHEADIKPVDGKVTFTVEDIIITISPRDELVQIKEATTPKE